jgi:hypothetical protein
MRKLVVPPAAQLAPGNSSLFELPLRLPERFELTLEAWGDRPTLSATRVVGLRLMRPAEVDEGKAARASWHQIRIVRDPALALWIDGQPIPIAANVGPTTWLSVEPPPHVSGEFRNLALTSCEQPCPKPRPAR